MVRLMYHKLHINKVVTKRYYRNTADGNRNSVRRVALVEQPEFPVRRACANESGQVIFNREIESRKKNFMTRGSISAQQMNRIETQA